MFGAAVSELEERHQKLSVKEVAKGVASRRLPASEGEHRDEEMMYAWSIGTTRAAAEYSAPKRVEECPPEVYIG